MTFITLLTISHYAAFAMSMPFVIRLYSNPFFDEKSELTTVVGL